MLLLNVSVLTPIIIRLAHGLVGTRTLLVLRCAVPAIRLTPLEVFALLLAAVCHDVDHPGVSNSLQVKQDAPIAEYFKAMSVNESLSIARLLFLIRQPDCNVLLNLPVECQRQVRAIATELIQATDIEDASRRQQNITEWRAVCESGFRADQSIDRLRVMRYVPAPPPPYAF